MGIKYLNLAIIIFLICVSTSNAVEQPERLPGLVLKNYIGNNYQKYSGNVIQSSLNYKYYPLPLINHDDATKKNIARDWSINLIGQIEITQGGRYIFSGINMSGENRHGILRIGDAWFTVAGEHSVQLSKGYHRIELYQPWGKCNNPFYAEIQWKIPGSEVFSEIPKTVLFHSKVDEISNNPFIYDISIYDKKITEYIITGKIDVEKDGFYRFVWCGKADNFSVSIDSQQQPLMGVAMKNINLGFSNIGNNRWSTSTLNYPMFLKTGTHTIDIYTNAGLYAARTGAAPIHMGFYRIDPINNQSMTLSVTETDPGNTVFRKGEKFTWKFLRSTIDGKPFTYRVSVYPQREENITDREVWSGEVHLSAGMECAQAELSYACNIEGAFEYKIFEESGKEIEGPWQFVVIDPNPLLTPRVGDNTVNTSKPVLVDTIDCFLEENDKEHHFRDNKTSKAITNGDLKYRQSGSKNQRVTYNNIGWEKDRKTALVAEANVGHKINGKRKGLQKGVTDIDWFGYTLNVKHPQKAHLIVAYIPADKYRRIPVQAIDPITGRYNGGFLEVKELPGSQLVKLEIPFWPTCESIDILTYPSSAYHGTVSTQSAISKIELYEYPDGFPALEMAKCGWNPQRYFGWAGEQANLCPETATTPILWNNQLSVPQAYSSRAGIFGGSMGLFMDYKAYFTAWSRYGEYSRFNGYNYLKWPIHSYDMAHIKNKYIPWGKDLFADGGNGNYGIGYRPIDKYRRDTLKIILLLCEKYGIDFIGDIQINGDWARYGEFICEIEDVPQEKWTEIKDQDLFLKYKNKIGASDDLDPSHPVARSYMTHFYGSIAEQYGKYPSFKGINIRQWENFGCVVSAWFGRFDRGYGNGTISRFERDTGIKTPLVEQNTNKNDLYDIRYDFLMKNPQNREKWFQWRADKVFSLRKEILDIIKKYSKNMQLFSDGAKPDMILGAGLSESQLLTDKNFGFSCSVSTIRVTGIELNMLDPFSMFNFDIRKNCKQLNANEKLASGDVIYPIGMCTNSGLMSSPYTMKEAAIFLARQPIDLLMQGIYWCLPSTNDQMKKWIQIWRAIPSLNYEKLPSNNNCKAVTCWKANDKEGNTVFYLINTSENIINAFVHGDKDKFQAVDMVTGIIENSIKERMKVIVEPFGVKLFKAYGNVNIVDVSTLSDIIPVKVDLNSARPKWMLSSSNKRIVFDIVNPGEGELSDYLMIIKGEDIYKYLPLKEIMINQLRLFINNSAIEFQVDRCDETGNYILEKRDVLGLFDEICFKLPFKKDDGSCQLSLYIAPTVDRQSLNSDFSVKTNKIPDTQKPYKLYVDNGLIGLGITNSGITQLRSGNESIYTSRTFDSRSLMPNFNIGEQAEPTVYSEGPVRILFGSRSVQKSDYKVLYQRQNAYLERAVSSRVYQMVSKGRDISIINRFRYKMARLPDIKYYWPITEYITIGEREFDIKGHLDVNGVYSSTRNSFRNQGISIWNTQRNAGYYIVSQNPHDLWFRCDDALYVTLNKTKVPEKGFDYSLSIKIPDAYSKEDFLQWCKAMNLPYKPYIKNGVYQILNN